MITSIDIENLRGIRSGRLEGLAPLTILTGPNACGKSTVLDALLIATSPSPAEAVGQAVQRHPVVPSGASWLISTSAKEATLHVSAGPNREWTQSLKKHDHCPDALREHFEAAKADLRQRDALPPFSLITVERDPSRPTPPNLSATVFSSDNQYEILQQGRGRSAVPAVSLVDPGLPVPLHQAFSRLGRTGRREDVYDLLSALVPQFQQLEITVDDVDNPTLCVTSAGRTIPAGLAGDGIQAFLQLALESAVAPGGLVLLEEPEVYQHPKAIWQTARALLANVRRGVQMTVTTHSLELIDALLAEASEEDLEGMALFNLLLEDGKLVIGYRQGKDISFARQTLENDLR